MPKSYFSTVADSYPEILLKNASWIFFNESCKIFILRTYSLWDSSGRLFLIFRKPDIQTFNTK